MDAENHAGIAGVKMGQAKLRKKCDGHGWHFFHSVARGAPFGLPEWVGQLAAQHGMESTLRPRRRWNQRQRHQAFEWISCHAKAILRTRMKSDQRSVHAARRHAVEAWLSDQALIEVH